MQQAGGWREGGQRTDGRSDEPIIRASLVARPIYSAWCASTCRHTARQVCGIGLRGAAGDVVSSRFRVMTSEIPLASHAWLSRRSGRCPVVLVPEMGAAPGRILDGQLVNH